MTIEERAREWLERYKSIDPETIYEGEQIITALLERCEEQEKYENLVNSVYDLSDEEMSRLKSSEDYAKGYACGAIASNKLATRAAYERVLELVDDVDEVTVSGYYAQLGDAAATKRNIIKAIRKEMEEL